MFIFEYVGSSCKYKTQKALQDLAKAFDMELEQAKETDEVKESEPLTNAEKYKHLPIRFAEKPDAMALAGIWKNNPITAEELRKIAWGDRA